jgi:hypothetical protein
MSVKNNLTEAILHSINQKSTATDVGLLNGLAGKSLYFFYRNYLFDEEASYEKAVAQLHQVIESFGNDTSHTTFHNGIAGIGWMISHLNEANIIEIAIEDFLDTSVDAFLYQDMIKHLNTGIYDFFYGASGICYYFIHRYTATEDKALKETYKNYITHFLFYMEYIGLNNLNGMYWKHHHYPFEDDGISYQLSSERNISAVMMVLIAIASTGDFNPVSIPLLQKSSNWLMNKLETSQHSSIDEAFCLWKVGRVLHDLKLEAKAFQFLKNKENHLSKQNTISLFKIALVYKKIAQETEDDFFKEKAIEYYKMASSRFSMEDVTDVGIWKGNVGIGLIDFTFNHGLDMEWAKCMLV